ncbi:MAG: NAD(+)/NADH kinase [Deltaproteobacteria bacterium]|nr:NAD(+)/NADH kinase [Deltaproteobacteria bacterium]
MSARPTSVLVVYKKSAYTVHVRENRDARVKKLLAAGDPSVAKLPAANRQHEETMREVRDALARLKVRARYVPLTLELDWRKLGKLVEDARLVVTVGGDGTLLSASHSIGPDRPVVAVNSAPSFSVGYFCGITQGEARDGLAAALDGRLPVAVLARMKVERDGELLHARVLNDALFCAASPAETSRYILKIGDVSEEQKSSGVWVGPAAGSTAAQRSAGGRVLPPTSRKLQFVVREPYVPKGERYALRKGLVPEGESLVAVSKMMDGRLYLDGPHRMLHIHMGEHIAMTLSDEPLSILGFRHVR